MAKLAEGRKWQNRVLHASRNTVERLYIARQRPEEALIKASVKYLPAAITSGA